MSVSLYKYSALAPSDTCTVTQEYVHTYGLQLNTCMHTCTHTCMCFACTHTYIQRLSCWVIDRMYAWCLWSSEECWRLPRTVLMDTYEPRCGCRHSVLGPLPKCSQLQSRLPCRYFSHTVASLNRIRNPLSKGVFYLSILIWILLPFLC